MCLMTFFQKVSPETTIPSTVKTCMVASRTHCNGDQISAKLKSRWVWVCLLKLSQLEDICNFKLLWADHWFHVANFIQAKLNLLDTQNTWEEEEGKGIKSDKQKRATSPITCGNIYLGVTEHLLLIQSIIKQHNHQLVFRTFLSGLVSFLSAELGQENARIVKLSTEAVWQCSCQHRFKASVCSAVLSPQCLTERGTVFHCICATFQMCCRQPTL